MRVLDGFGTVPAGVRWLHAWDAIRNLVVHHFGEDPYTEGVGLCQLMAAAAGRVTGEVRVLDVHPDRLEVDVTAAQARRMVAHRHSIRHVHIASGGDYWEHYPAEHLAKLLLVARTATVRLTTFPNYWLCTQEALEDTLRGQSFHVHRVGGPGKGAFVKAEWRPDVEGHGCGRC